MSGGHFNYNQYKIDDIAEQIDRIVELNGSEEVDGFGYSIGYNYPSDIIEKFKETSELLSKCSKMVQRIDWLVCDDDGEECFRRRWFEEMGEY